MTGIRILLFLLSLVLPVSAVQAQNLKIGFVDAGKIIEESSQAEQARSRLEREFAPRNKGLGDAQKAVRRLEDKLARDGAVMGETERRRLERDIIAQKRDLKRSQTDFQEDFNIRRNEELGKLQRLVYEVIVQLAKEQGFDLIVNAGAVIYASEQVDITDQVLRRLQ